MITGAQAIARIAKCFGVRFAFAYPGTSELALCIELEKLAGVRLVNGRGDRECAFMAAGASYFRQGSAISVLHAARGLTNAIGAIGAARRNEIGCVHVVGLASTRTSRYLPPHAEWELLKSTGAFAKEWVDLSEEFVSFHQTGNSQDFVRRSISAFLSARVPPFGPVILGIPQDAAESTWIEDFDADKEASAEKEIRPERGDLLAAIELIRASRHPLIIVDDFALRDPGAEDAINLLANRSNAKVLQVKYRRGPMLFQRIQRSNIESFIGYLERPEHDELLKNSDLIVTVEDRNMYPRVVGPMPPCAKVAVTSNVEMTRKNGYLDCQDIVITGDVVPTISTIAEGISDDKHRPLNTKFDYVPRDQQRKTCLTHVARSIGVVLQELAFPTIVDDSQTFGGIIRENYDLLPSNIVVIGDHSGFVGAGIATATGLAIANEGRSILCLLGDQGFTNGIQALFACKEENARIVFLLCDNGGSVSLNKEVTKNHGVEEGRFSWLANASSVSYAALAAGFGIKVWSVFQSDVQQLEIVLRKAFQYQGPSVIHLKLKGDEITWDGVWETKGMDE